MKSFVAAFFILFGIVCLIQGAYLFWQRINPRQLAFDSYQETTQQAKENSNPVAITIDSIGIHVPIRLATITNNKWQAATDGISYLITSPVPGENGNSILYGHNWTNLLGSLPKVKPGQKVRIDFSNGTSKVFTITHTEIVTPDQTQILDESKDKRITLYTCYGFLDLKRFVVTATLDSV